MAPIVLDDLFIERNKKDMVASERSYVQCIATMEKSCCSPWLILVSSYGKIHGARCKMIKSMPVKIASRQDCVIPTVLPREPKEASHKMTSSLLLAAHCQHAPRGATGALTIASIAQSQRTVS